MYWSNLKSVDLPIPEIIAIRVLAASCEPQSWGRGGRMGSGMVPFEQEAQLPQRNSASAAHVYLQHRLAN